MGTTRGLRGESDRTSGGSADERAAEETAGADPGPDHARTPPLGSIAALPIHPSPAPGLKDVPDYLPGLARAGANTNVAGLP